MKCSRKNRSSQRDSTSWNSTTGFSACTGKRLQNNVIEFEDDILREANMLKLQYRKRKLSYIDCIGYIISKRLGIPFLTGDKEFRNLENVEFVK